MTKSTNIIAYTHEDSFMLCLTCWSMAAKHVTADEYKPYFESDRDGGEYCDSCLNSI